jgi:PAS domain-containing protein
MKILEEKEKFIYQIIRDSIALNPLVSIRGLQEAFEKRTGRSISDKYVSKLRDKMRTRSIVESDRKKLNERLAEVRERYRVLSENLLRTIYWNWESLKICGIQQPNEKQRQSAIKLLAQMELALLRLELDMGVFENRQLAISEMLKQGTLPTELHEQIVGVFRTWKLGSPVV